MKIAQDRADAKYGMTFDGGTTLLIGDTPNDVATGGDGGARVVAVASGKSTAQELRAAGAEHVLENLLDIFLLRQALKRT